jgi:hypothetical protein
MTIPTHGFQLKMCWLLMGAILLSCCSCTKQSSEDARSKVTVTKEGPFFLRNERRYVKDNINFFCRPIKHGNNYATLIMGSPSKPYAGRPPVRARFPDGTVVNLAEVTTNRLKDFAWSMKDVSGDSCAEIAAADFVEDHATWPTNTLRIQFNYWLFFVQDDSVLSVSVWDYGKGELKPAIGNPATGAVYEFPLSQDQVIHIFGTPDVIKEYWTE